MRTLVVGAGAVGGYIGGRLLEINRDVTFLVRPRRAAILASSGLRIRSQMGNATLLNPPTILAGELGETYDLVLLACKAYDLEGAVDSFAPAVGPDTVILPLLNGMRHLDFLDERFGGTRVLGGLCVIASSLTEEGEIVHLNNIHQVSFGERDGTMSDRVMALAKLMEGALINARTSAEILLNMWEKWVFLASLAAGTCLLRATVGDICNSPGGTDLVFGLLDECCSIASAEGYQMGDAYLKRTRDMLATPGSTLTASMLRDMERNAPIEAEHIMGDLIERGRRHNLFESGISLLGIAYTHLKAYEARRFRAMQASSSES